MIEKKRSSKQNTVLSTRRNVGLENVVQATPGFSCQGKVGEFIDLYLCCEVFATKLQHFYQNDKPKNKGSLNTTDLKNALEYFNLYFENESLLLIFRGGTGHRGKKSARQLRNGYFHKLSSADKTEIENKMEYIKLMKHFLRLRLKT